MLLEGDEEQFFAWPPVRVNSNIDIRIVRKAGSEPREEALTDLESRLKAARDAGDDQGEAAILQEAVRLVEGGSPFELAVIVGQHAIQKDMDRAWASIEIARAALNKHQGESIPFIRHAVIARYARMSSQGLTPGDIAAIANREFGVSLCIELVEKAHNARSRQGLELALCIFLAMRVKAKKTRDLLWATVDLVSGHTLREIEANGELLDKLKAAVRREWFTRDNIKYAIRAWPKEEGLYGSFVPSAPRAKDTIDLDALFNGSSFGREALPLRTRLMTD